MDLTTLQAATALVCSMGTSHFEASNDTKLSMEARKAHKFVAMNCETLARKTLALSGKPGKETEPMLMTIMGEIRLMRKGTVG
jgi:hypothetical protein